MTTYTWDSSKILSEFPACQTLGDIIGCLEARAESEGHVICEIGLNGVMLSEEQETKLKAENIQTIETLQVKMDRPARLVSTAYITVRDFLPILENLSEELANDLRVHGLKESGTKTTELIDGCYWVVETLAHIRSAAKNIGKPIRVIERWYEAEKRLAFSVQEISDHLTARDIIQMADSLEYELTTALQVWTEVLAEQSHLADNQ